MRLWHRLRRWFDLRSLRSVLDYEVRRGDGFSILLFAVVSCFRKRPAWNRYYDDDGLWRIAGGEVEAAVKRAVGDGRLNDDGYTRACREIAMAMKRRKYGINAAKNL
jgi:hypothetical protein